MGAVAGAAGWLASLALPHALAATVAFAAGVLLTGAIHFDGFLDGCDAFFAAAPAERRLEILKDPRHGTFAVVGMFVAGSFWLAALLALEPRTYPAVLAFSGALARAAAVVNAVVFRYAPGGTTTPAFARRPPVAPLASVLVLLAVVAFWVAPADVLIVPLAVGLVLILGRSIARRLGGGLVGDAYGFSIVVLEVVILIAIVAVRPTGIIFGGQATAAEPQKTVNVSELNVTNYLHLPIGELAPEEMNVVVEIPEGSRNKYEYDKKLNVFRLDRALHSPIYYPGDYGFVPRTLAEDGDPLDVLILVVQPTFAGCLVVARPIGLLKMIDNGEPDDKVLCVPVGEPAYNGVHTSSQIFPHTLRTISHFFETYKTLEGKKTSTQGWQDAAAARRSVIESVERFKTANPDFERDHALY